MIVQPAHQIARGISSAKCFARDGCACSAPALRSYASGSLVIMDFIYRVLAQLVRGYLFLATIFPFAEGKSQRNK